MNKSKTENSQPILQQHNIVRLAYYTPTLDEFHVGFEYQIKVAAPPKNNWKDETICQFHRFEDLKKWLEKGEIRVKRIDKEDCLSLGFKERDGEFCLGVYTLSGQIEYGNIKIEKYFEDYPMGKHTYWSETVFDGRIKNKSELKRILQQSGCVQS